MVDNNLQIPGGQNTTTYTYDPASNLATVTYPNGLSSNFTYDDLNRVTALNDGIYRLTNETISLDPHVEERHGRVRARSGGQPAVPDRQLPGVPTASFTYDANDRLSRPRPTTPTATRFRRADSFAYDFENRVKSDERRRGDAAIRRRRQPGGEDVGGVTTRYLVDDLNPTGYAQVVEEMAAGAVQRTYTYGLQRISQNQLISGAWTPSFYGYDGMAACAY